MQITVVGDEIRVDGAAVGVIQGGPLKEREALRSALRSSPDVICESGGPASFVDDDLQGQLDDAGRDNDGLRADVVRLETELEDARTEVDDLLAAIVNALEELKNDNPAKALEILGIALDA